MYISIILGGESTWTLPPLEPSHILEASGPAKGVFKAVHSTFSCNMLKTKGLTVVLIVGCFS